ncbi:triphosphoribosyl-dephospho-CoA synthase [Ideonella sp.]|uniref:triphosphoribosyl-dephospho-CoA synthase n=1 Tax=Ideonella sp. TaxID=1929293 RepID=UPI00351AFA59
MKPAPTSTAAQATERARASYLVACELDVAVRKPGNVSRLSAGHGMQAALFSDSARASVGPMFRPGARVGDRIEAAVAASWEAAGCNTNLGIVLLCAPIARAIELHPQAEDAAALRAAIEEVLADLDLADARAAYRAIAQAHPGGLGSAAAQDVHDVPSMGLRAAMALAADRDSIARQYRDGYDELFELGVPAAVLALPGGAFTRDGLASPAVSAAVQRTYLAFLATLPDSHIVRKHGAALAHTVMRSAQRWQTRALNGENLDADPDFVAWDLELKAAGLNPGTSADFTVAALFVAGLVAQGTAAR